MKVFILIVLLIFQLQSQSVDPKIITHKIDILQLNIHKNDSLIGVMKTENDNTLKLIAEYKLELSKIAFDTMPGMVIYSPVENCLYLEPSISSKCFKKVTAGDSLKIVDLDNYPYIKVFYKGVHGYNLSASFTDSAGNVIKLNRDIESQIKDERIRLQNEEKEEIKKVAQKKQAVANEKYKSSLISKYGKNIGVKIYNKQAELGMTSAMISTIMGKPNEINRSGGSWGIHEQWIYDNIYLYFENDTLKSWQD